MAELIAATAGAVSASADTEFRVHPNRPVTLSASDLAGGSVDVTYSGDSGANFATAYNYDTQEALQLTATKPQLYLRGPGRYRVSKSATTNPCSVNTSEFS